MIENYTFISEGNYEKEDEMSLFYKNNYRINWNSTTVLLPLNNRVKSLNPYGATSVEQVIGLGLLNLLLIKK